ncbi:MAG TPA: DegV family protein [Candidatus Merdisoma merdipullorum]|nr:DegV family protein [Candidatus Merdisoma merdipullorum]
MKYKIVMDSSSNLFTMEDVNFSSVPLKIVTDQKEFVDDQALDLEGMLAFLSSYKGRSGTSCPNISEWLDAFGDAEGIFALTITGTLSGCHNAAVQAKEAYEKKHPGRRVCCLDSLSTGPEMVLIAEKLRELICSGKDFDQIETEIRTYMKRTHLIFTLKSLNNMARNGRVSPLIAKACGLLGIQIVGQASAEGTLEPLHKCRGEAKALKLLLTEMKKMNFQGGKVRIVHCHNEQAAQTFLELLKTEFPDCDASLGNTTALCSFYAEEGGVMIGFEA